MTTASPHSVKSRWQTLLGIVCAMAVVGFHTGLPGTGLGWAAVEVFFVMAGMRMVSDIRRGTPLPAYLGSRARRLGFEIAVVWMVSITVLLCGTVTPGLLWFAGTAPLFLQNVSVAFFAYEMPIDAIFGPLWFTGALVQMQLAALWLSRAKPGISPLVLVSAAFVAGCGSRALFSLACGSPMDISGQHATVLYCMPFCHPEALALGIAMGGARGIRPVARLPMLAGLLFVIASLVAHSGIGAGMRWLPEFVFPLRENASAVWGYPVLALAAAGICGAQSTMDGILGRIRIPEAADRLIGFVSAHTYGIYCFHGMVIASGLFRRLPGVDGQLGRVLAFCFTFALSLAISVVVRRAANRMERFVTRKRELSRIDD
jgi:hypothetical protein